MSPFLVSSNGNFGYDSFDVTSRDALAVGFGETINAPCSHLFEAAWNDTIKRGITTQAVFQQALNRASLLATPFPGTGLGDQLGLVARLIAARRALGASSTQYRDIARTCNDTHDDATEFRMLIFSQLNTSIVVCVKLHSLRAQPFLRSSLSGRRVTSLPNWRRQMPNRCRFWLFATSGW